MNDEEIDQKEAQRIKLERDEELYDTYGLAITDQLSVLDCVNINFDNRIIAMDKTVRHCVRQADQIVRREVLNLYNKRRIYLDLVSWGLAYRTPWPYMSPSRPE